MNKLVKKINSFIENKEYNFYLQGAELVDALDLPFHKGHLPAISFYRDEINRDLPIKHYSFSNIGFCNESNNINGALKVIKEQHDYFLFLLAFIPFLENCFNNNIKVDESHLMIFRDIIKQ